jgi:hypothetical protein
MTHFQQYALVRLFQWGGFLSAEQLLIAFFRFHSVDSLTPDQAMKDLLNLTKGKNPLLLLKKYDTAISEGVEHRHLYKLIFQCPLTTLKLDPRIMPPFFLARLRKEFLFPLWTISRDDGSAFWVERLHWDDYQLELIEA